jgi:dihydrofolate synthase / folylpolyglutamate synthase
MLTYEQATAWIKNKSPRGIDLGLQRVEWLLQELGNPERLASFVHIGGTNGKGSTLTFLQQILLESNLCVGSFTSPSLTNYNEHIGVNGMPISNEDFSELVSIIQPVSDRMEQETGWPPATEFEIITVMMFYYFGMVKEVDLVLVEVGLGGRMDSTNVLNPLISIITNVGLDHTNILGVTVEEIAKEKAGIIKDNSYLITGSKRQEVIDILVAEAKKRKSQVLALHQDFFVEKQFNDFSYLMKEEILKDLSVSMKGNHQMENAALAITSSFILRDRFDFPISENSIRNGIQKAKWKGRFEVLSDNPCIIIDGAHNEDGMNSLVDTLKQQYPNGEFVFLAAALQDKDYSKMLSIMNTVSQQFIFTQFLNDRVLSVESLANASKAENIMIIRDWKEAIQYGIEYAKNGSILVITGSLYFLSNVRPIILSRVGRHE